MKVSFRSAPLGLVMLGAAALIGAAAPVGAQETTPSPSDSIAGLVTVATDATATVPGSVTIHPAVGGDLTLTVAANTHFRKAGGEQDTPDEIAPTGGGPAAKVPSPTWFVGLFARATFDSSHVALNLLLSRPEPVQVNGVVDSVTPTDLILDVKGQGMLDLTLGAPTAIRLDGFATTADKLVKGDLANALYWPTASGNEALRVDARTPPPLHFEGVLGAPVVVDGGAPVGFTATRGTTTMQFMESAGTVFSLDGKTATAADLKAGDMVNVLYQTDGSVDNALQVMAFTPKPKPTPKPPVTGGDHHSGSNSNGDSDKGKTKPPRPIVFGGVVGTVDATGQTFTVSQGTNKTLTFSVDANTNFQSNDKPATFANLAMGQHVYVIYQGTSSSNLALKVLILQPTTGGAQP